MLLSALLLEISLTALLELRQGDVLECADNHNSKIYQCYSSERQNRLVPTLKGNDHALYKLTQMIKQLVAECCEEGDQVRGLPELAVANEYCEYIYASKNERPVMVSVLEVPHFAGGRYVGIFELPRSHHLVARLIGRQRSGIIIIEENSRCKVRVVQERTRRNHMCVFGDQPQDVAEGLHLLKLRLDSFVVEHEGDNARRSRRRDRSRGRAHAPDLSEDALL